MSIIDNPFLDFVRFSLHDNAEIPASAFRVSWPEMLETAKKQSIVGVCWQGIQRLGGMSENKPTDDDVMEWMGEARKTEKRNKTVSERAAWVYGNFKTEGFNACVLKGQGNALLYPDALMRTPGDIDVWVIPQSYKKGDDYEECIRQTIKYCKELKPNARSVYHHIDFRKAGDVEVEVHYRPSWMNNPINNRRIQQWFLEHAGECMMNETISVNGNKLTPGYAVPTWEFNVVFQLSHIFKHLLQEGIGLRQLIDYYYLLCNRPDDSSVENIAKTIQHLGLSPIAGAVIWIMKNVLGLEERFLVYESNRKTGLFMLNEVVESGNFGKFDERKMSGHYRSPIMKNLQRLVRDERMVGYFPSECLWEPWFRVYHYLWRRRH